MIPFNPGGGKILVSGIKSVIHGDLDDAPMTPNNFHI